MPCCAWECEESLQTELSTGISHERGGEKDDCCKTCSPFYICGNCTGFVLVFQSLFTSPAFALVQNQKNGFYLLKKLPQVFVNIWQPPRLV